MPTSEGQTGHSPGARVATAAGVIVVSSVMFTFISSWRTAAIVLCDLGSTSYYIGGIVEQSVGKAAPWFIIAVMLFSYAVRSVYIESCSLYVRGGVYRVVREALGSLAAKVAVSALLFDYVLTGPTSALSAGQYIIGLLLEGINYAAGHPVAESTAQAFRCWGSILLAMVVTIYFFRQNLLGIHESSGKALKIMIATSIMAVVILGWGALTWCLEGSRNTLSFVPDLAPKLNPATQIAESPLGFLSGTGLGARLEQLGAGHVFGLIGLFGIAIAFGHSILAMSGEETLAQVYREVESPKLRNFRRAAFIVFAFSLALTGGACLLAVVLIPDHVRMAQYADNLIGGLAMHVVGPVWARLLLNGFVVVVGFLILSGAVNTAIIGSNGVLNRVAEDGVVPDWLRKPHPRYGTTHRILYVILGLQLFTILASRGDVLVLGEAYAVGVVWSFVFMSLSMLVLRFKNRASREFKVPLNIRVAGVEVPLGLGAIFLILFIAAIANLLTKETATKWGLGFTVALMTMFLITEFVNRRRRQGRAHEHLEQFNRRTEAGLTRESLGLNKPYCKLVAVRSPQSMFMLERALAETDPATTGLVVMTATVTQGDEGLDPGLEMSDYEQRLMTGVVQRAELAGKQVKPLIVPTNNPLHAVLRMAADLKAQEVVIGASNKYTAEEQLDVVTLYWLSLHGGTPAPLTIRVISRNRDLSFDLGGGNRIPKISERQARSISELRAAGVGVDRVLVLHDGTSDGHDLFQAVLTMLDPQVVLSVVNTGAAQPAGLKPQGPDLIQQSLDRATQLRREVELVTVDGDLGPGVVRLVEEGDYDLLIYQEPEWPTSDSGVTLPTWPAHVLSVAPCAVLIAPRRLAPPVTDT
jgi:amino acid transporter